MDLLHVPTLSYVSLTCRTSMFECCFESFCAAGACRHGSAAPAGLPGTALLHRMRLHRLLRIPGKIRFSKGFYE